MHILKGFSKLNREEKIDFLKKYVPMDQYHSDLLEDCYENPKKFEEIIGSLSENYISNYMMPFSVAPNFLVNDALYAVPMVTEESSVVAAAAYAAKFWSDHGGFKTEILGTSKTGQVYFYWNGDYKRLLNDLPLLRKSLLEAVKPLTVNMEKRGGGVMDISLQPSEGHVNEYYTLMASFQTADSMGANFINSCLETMGRELIAFIHRHYPDSNLEAEVIMAILSNYTPQCVVKCTIECDIQNLAPVAGNLSPEKFAQKFKTAVRIAQENIDRAVTHNKGIFNGVDAMLIATGNDFRAVEACGHAYAAREGKYRALNDIEISESRFKYQLQIPLAVGTVGGITTVHPMAKTALHMLGNPSAEELMRIIAAVGMASNFAAIRSLITDGIQKGHMKLHLDNILSQLEATPEEKTVVKKHFRTATVSHHAVTEYLQQIRGNR